MTVNHICDSLTADASRECSRCFHHLLLPGRIRKMFCVAHREAAPPLIMDECGVSGLQEDGGSGWSSFRTHLRSNHPHPRLPRHTRPSPGRSQLWLCSSSGSSPAGSLVLWSHSSLPCFCFCCCLILNGFIWKLLPATWWLRAWNGGTRIGWVEGMR